MTPSDGSESFSTAFADAAAHATSLEVEAQLLGCVLFDATVCAEEGLDAVDESFFTIGTHRLVWGEIARRRRSGETIGEASVGTALLGKVDVLDLLRICKDVPSAGSFRDHLAAAKSLVARRVAIEAVFRAAHELRSPGDVEAIRCAVEFAMQRSRAVEVGAVEQHFAEVAPQAADELHGSAAFTTPSGVGALDRLLQGGFRSQSLYVLAARPSIGKTTLALNLALNVARQKVPVLFVTLEMPSRQLGAKLIVVEADEARPTREATAAASERLSDLPLFFLARLEATLGQTVAAIRSVAAKRNAGLVVVDYLGLLPAERRDASSYERVTAASRAMKLLAFENRLPVLAVAQLNRAVEKDGGEPQLHHLRDSGAVEQDADVVMMLHRTAGMATDLLVAKNRNGATGKVQLLFRPEVSRYVENDMGLSR